MGCRCFVTLMLVARVPVVSRLTGQGLVLVDMPLVLPVPRWVFGTSHRPSRAPVSHHYKAYLVMWTVRRLQHVRGRLLQLHVM